MKENEKRVAFLNRIIQADSDFISLIKELEGYDWDFNDTPTVLNSEAVKNVLARYATGALSAELVHKWADFLELRDDVDYGANEGDFIGDVLHELANPDLEGALTRKRAQSLIEKL